MPVQPEGGSRRQHAVHRTTMMVSHLNFPHIRNEPENIHAFSHSTSEANNYRQSSFVNSHDDKMNVVSSNSPREATLLKCPSKSGFVKHQELGH